MKPLLQYRMIIRNAMTPPIPQKKEIDHLKTLEAILEDELDLYYFDASSFSSVSNVPYVYNFFCMTTYG